ncbi:MAG TPA: hypothetical protein VIL37_01680 [Natronosporangium sp.]
MDIAALITWLLTATGGFIMLGIWINKGGHKAGSGSRLAPGLVFGHFGLAAIGLVLWIIYLVANESVLAWIAFVLLLVVALIGFTMFARWLPVRSGSNAESRFPLAVVGLHGLLAATTLVLVLLTVLDAS